MTAAIKYVDIAEDHKSANNTIKSKSRILQATTDILRAWKNGTDQDKIVSYCLRLKEKLTESSQRSSE